MSWLLSVFSLRNTRKGIYSIILFCSKKRACKMICCIQFPILPFQLRLKWCLFRTNQICKFSHSFDKLISNCTGKSTRKNILLHDFSLQKKIAWRTSCFTPTWWGRNYKTGQTGSWVYCVSDIQVVIIVILLKKQSINMRLYGKTRCLVSNIRELKQTTTANIT